MTNQSADDRFDAQLRDVSTPEGLLQRLRQSIAPTDNELDGELKRVAIPAGFHERLIKVALHEQLDEQLDQWLQDVPEPWGMSARLRIIPHTRRRSWVSRLALAASLFMLIGAGYLTSVYGLLSSTLPTRNNPDPLLLVYQGPLDLNATQAPTPVEVELIAPKPQPSPLVEYVSFPNEFTLVDHSLPTSGPAGQLFRDLDNGLNVWQDTLAMRWGVLGFPQYTDDKLPELEVVLPHFPRGMKTPVLPGYDSQFLFTKNAHPQVLLANSHPQLQQLQPPVSTDTSSVEYAERRLTDRQAIEPERIHVEDFLAAVDYRWSQPKRAGLRLHTAAGPSVFASPGVALLQFGVQASDLPAVATKQTHLTVALDISASMRWSGRLDKSRNALLRLFDNLRSSDRVTLVLFNEEAYAVADYASREDIPALTRLLKTLKPNGGTNAVAGLQQAIRFALDHAVDRNYRHEVVLISDDEILSQDHSLSAIHSLVDEAASWGIRLSVADLNSPANHSFIQSLAVRAEGKLLKTRDEDEFSWELIELLLGQTSVVGEDVEMTIRFNPKSVVAYRLLGHEATQLGGMLPADPRATLRLGQGTSTLVEVILNTDTLKKEGGPEIATAELNWTNPRTGQLTRQQKKLTRYDLGPFFAGNAQTPLKGFQSSPASLQQAAIAAEIAEVLRQSPFVNTKQRNMRVLLSAVDQLSPSITTTSGMKRLVDLAHQLNSQRSR